MFVLGVTLRDKKKQQQVYPNIGPIFGYFELASLGLLLVTGIGLLSEFDIIHLLFSDDNTEVVRLLRLKLYLVLFVVIATAVHFYIALKTNGKERTKIQNLLSRGSSMFIFFVNLAIMHYAIVIRTILS